MEEWALQVYILGLNKQINSLKLITELKDMHEVAGTMAVLYPLMFGTVQKDCEEDDIGGEVEKEGKS